MIYSGVLIIVSKYGLLTKVWLQKKKQPLSVNSVISTLLSHLDNEYDDSENGVDFSGKTIYNKVNYLSITVGLLLSN